MLSRGILRIPCSSQEDSEATLGFLIKKRGNIELNSNETRLLPQLDAGHRPERAYLRGEELHYHLRLLLLPEAHPKGETRHFEAFELFEHFPLQAFESRWRYLVPGLERATTEPHEQPKTNEMMKIFEGRVRYPGDDFGGNELLRRVETIPQGNESIGLSLRR